VKEGKGERERQRQSACVHGRARIFKGLLVVELAIALSILVVRESAK